MESLVTAANRGSVSTGYDIDNSIMFSTEGTYADANSLFYDLMKQSEGFAANANAGTNARKCTVSAWVKRTKITNSSHYDRIFSYRGGGVAFDVYFDPATDQLTMYDDNTSMSLKTNRAFRDTSAWYHIVVAVDQTQGTAANRVNVYVNGVQETSFATEDYGNQNVDLSAFRAEVISVYVGGAAHEASAYFNGYISEYNFIDGAQLAQTEFGEFDDDTGIWIPKEFTGSYGTLGHYYNFTVSNDMGKDFSGNGNDCNNRGDGIANGAARQATDTPTNNFCTLNLQVSNYANTGGAKDGGTFMNVSGVNAFNAYYGTQGFTKGKWYWESYIVSRSGSYGLTNEMGVHTMENLILTDPYYANAFKYSYYLNFHYGYTYAWDNGTKGSKNSEDGFPDLGASSVGKWVGLAFNADDGKATWYIDGTQTGNANLDIYDLHDRLQEGVFGVPFFQVYDNDLKVNFGGFSSQTISSGNTDANGYGNFEYAVPSGYYSICTKNLAEFG